MHDSTKGARSDASDVTSTGLPAGARVLVIRLGALGDMVMVSAFLRHLIALHGDAGEVTLLTTPQFAPLFSGFDGLTVAAFPRQGFRARLRALGYIRRGGFARVYDLQSNHRTRILVGLSGVPQRVGLWPLWPFTHHPDYGRERPEHIFTRTNDLLAAVGLPAAPETLNLPVSTEAMQRVAAWRQTQGLEPGRYVLCHAGASPIHPEKRWPGFAELAGHLHAAGWQMVWVGGPDDVEVNRTLSTRVGIDATSAFTLPELCELARSAAFAVTNDSAPMHAIAAAGTPVFALFGPTDWRRCHAVGQRERVLEAPLDPAGRRPLDGLKVESVLSRINAEGFAVV